MRGHLACAAMLSLLIVSPVGAWKISPASTPQVRAAAELCIDEFELDTLQMPLLAFPGWKEKARTEAISKWSESRQTLLAGSEPHALLVAMRNEEEAGRFFEGVEDGLLGFAELGLLPAPPEKKPEAEAAETETETAAAAAAAETAAPGAPPALFPYLANLAVRAGARRLGLGKALVEATEATARELGYERMYIKVDRQNFDARRLYDRMGYELVFMQNRMPDKTNRQAQFLFLRKRLEAEAWASP